MTIKKKVLINLLPFAMAILEPKKPPKALQTAMGKAMLQIMEPFNKNNRMEPKLVAKFTTFACALACKKSNPRILIKANTNKLPAPGPIKPS